jgi:DNA-binding beta-propeller fold protein YncE
MNQKRTTILRALFVTVALAVTVAYQAQATGAFANTNPHSQSDTNPYSQAFTAFESGQVRPLGITPDKKFLLAVNTPDAKLEIFKIMPNGLDYRTSVPVGLEPVSVAVRNNGEAWVVNLLSDSVSVVELNDKNSRVKFTLLVGDEPRDIVFAGQKRNRAFITTAHRGQNSPIDPQLSTPGVGRADVWVFDADSCCSGSSLGGTPLTILTFFSDTPRALAVTPDGSKVYMAAFFSGNGTATTFVNFFGLANPLPPAQLFFPQPPFPPFPLNVNAFGQPQPLTSVMVKYDGTHWKDENGLIRDPEMTFTLPDRDVFAIDANANPPAAIPGPAGIYAHVGTTLFNMTVNPANGNVYVSNLDSNNMQRFEGANLFAGAVTQPSPSVRGKIAFSRITVLSGAGGVTPRHLNKHIDYSVCCTLDPVENAKSVAFPIGMEITSNGQTLYVAALGSSKVAVYDTSQLENDTFIPSTANQIAVSGGGPTGLALDESANRLYVLTRFDNSIKIINTQSKAEIGGVSMFNPEPAHIVNGRRFLYDASFASSHGDSACFSCHIFGDTDHLAWNLGNPDHPAVADPNVKQNFSPRFGFDAMKGIMATQSLRGMDNMGPMHWRGDRTGGYAEPNAQPNSGAFNEVLAFKAFNVAFPDLLGRSSQIQDADMQAFADFILEVMYPPNPIRNLDNSLTPLQQEGSDLFFGRNIFFDAFGPTLNCNACHTIDRNVNAGQTSHPGFFGGNSLTTEVAGPFTLKNPHLRNAYQKVGKFGMPASPAFLPGPNFGVPTGEQIRGFGFTHDGGMDTVFDFLFAPNFGTGEVQAILPPPVGPPVNNPDGIKLDAHGIHERSALEAFVFAMDSNFQPIVGQQVTLTATNGAAAGARIDLLLARAGQDECEVIAINSKTGEGYLYSGGVFLRDKSNQPTLTPAQLRSLAAPDTAITYTCVPKGNGRRLALDRDLNGVLNGDQH